MREQACLHRTFGHRTLRRCCRMSMSISGSGTVVIVVVVVLRNRRRLQDASKRKLADFFFSLPLPVSSGWPEVDPTIDQNRRSGLKKSGWLKLLAGLTPKKGNTRRVNRKIADSTRNQRVFFSRYLAANYDKHKGLLLCNILLLTFSKVSFRSAAQWFVNKGGPAV